MKKFFLFILNVITVFYSFIWMMFTYIFLSDLNTFGDIYGFITFLLVSFPLVVLWFLFIKFRKAKSLHEERRVNIINNERSKHSAPEPLTPNEEPDLEYKDIQDIETSPVASMAATIQIEHQAEEPVEVPSFEEFNYKPHATVTEDNVVTNIISETTPVISLNQNVKENLLFSFNVAGVTMKNDRNKDIQKLLRRGGKLHCEENFIELYGGYTNKDILEYVFEVAEFEGLEFINNEISFIPEPTNEYDPNAIKVLIDFGNDEVHHIGYVPKIHTSTVNDILNNHETVNIVARYVGGKIKEVEYDFEKDKDIVITKELTLGVEIVIKDN